MNRMSCSWFGCDPEGAVAGLAGQDSGGIIELMTGYDCMSVWEMKSKALAALVAAALCGVPGSSDALAREANWPQFRGPGARGITTNTNLPERWSASENVAWKAEIDRKSTRLNSSHL